MQGVRVTGESAVNSFFAKSSKTRFWLVVVTDVLALASIPIFVDDASIGIGLAIVVAGLAVLHSVANWPYK